MWGHQHNDQPTAEELQSPRFLQYYQAEDIILLFDGQNEISGICTLKPEGKRDENGIKADLLDAPGVIKRYRQEGYQRQLVLAGITQLRKKGTRPILLEFWGESEQALDIYRSLGFEMMHRYITYHREIK
jgi:ribosomal protein S18 acetylase RimI-like enzyme